MQEETAKCKATNVRASLVKSLMCAGTTSFRISYEFGRLHFIIIETRNKWKVLTRRVL